jgi:hypothetical protein
MLDTRCWSLVIPAEAGILITNHQSPEVIIKAVPDIPDWLEKPLVSLILLYRRLRFGCPFRAIPLTRGKYAIVDPEDYQRLAKYKWHVEAGTRTFYAVRHIYIKPGKKKYSPMHRYIIDVSEGIFVDHINQNGLDNRKANLRLATRVQNSWNRQKTNKNTWSKYKGVCFHKRDKKWQAKIGLNGQVKHLGTFNSESNAAKAYDRAAKKYHGQFAVLNFKDEKD